MRLSSNHIAKFGLASPRWKTLLSHRYIFIRASFVMALLACIVGYAWVQTSTAHAYDATAFVMVVKTDNPGTSNATSFTIPTTGGGYSYNVDCDDDGVYEVTARTTSYTCIYESADTYTVAITGTFPRIYFNNGGDRQKLLEVKQWGTGAWTNMSNAFYGCNNLQVTATDTPNLTVATAISNMFLNATSLTGSSANWNWNTSNITAMNGMFQGATAFNGPIGNWDTSKVTNMSSMFRDATTFNQPIESWNTSAATAMASMFHGATTFNQPLDSWNVSKVTNMTSTFDNATSFNQPLNSWDTANVTTMRQMFRGARTFNSQIDSWNTSKVTSMYYMFSGANAFNQPVGSWDVSSVTSMARMFEGAYTFNQPLNDWDVSKVIDMNSIFRSTAFNQPLDNWDISSLTSLYAIFHGARNFNQPLNTWDVSNITDFGSLFFGASQFNQPLNNWDTSKATTMRQMFLQAYRFNQPIGMWNTSSVTDFNAMFYYAYDFNQPIGNWNVSKVTRFQEMFQGASSFNQFIGNWDTSSATNMIDMFTYARLFNNGQSADNSTTPLNWDTSKVTNMTRMFYYANNFSQPLTSFEVGSVTNMTDMLDNTAYTSNVYDQTLAHFAAQSVQPNVPLGVAGINFCDLESRTALTSPPNNWSIDDGDLCPVTVHSPQPLQIITDSTPTIQGSALPGEVILITLDGVDFTTITQPNGLFVYTVDTPLSDGLHEITFMSTDSATHPRVPYQLSFHVDATLAQVDHTTVTLPLAGTPVVHPVTNLPSERQLPKSISDAALSVTSQYCSNIQSPSVKLIEPDITITRPHVNILGGIGFNLTCSSHGQSAEVNIALGEAFQDITKLRAYKESDTNLQDITDRVTFTNENIDGTTKTIVSYSLSDGGYLDEDGVANGTIVDPIYIGVAHHDTAETLAETGASLWFIVSLAALTVIGSGGILVYAKRSTCIPPKQPKE